MKFVALTLLVCLLSSSLLLLDTEARPEADNPSATEMPRLPEEVDIHDHYSAMRSPSYLKGGPPNGIPGAK